MEIDHKLQVKIAKQIVNEGNCNGIDCIRHQFPLYPMPCSSENKQKLSRDWLAKNDKQEIIGWPGNVEEMRQYIGKRCTVKDRWEAEWFGGNATLEDIRDTPDESPYRYSGVYFRYCKILPESAITELTLDDIAKKFDIPVDQLRIKE